MNQPVETQTHGATPTTPVEVALDFYAAEPTEVENVDETFEPRDAAERLGAQAVEAVATLSDEENELWLEAQDAILRGEFAAYDDLDLLKVYVRQAGEAPLLNAEQEVEIAKRIEAGVLAQEKLDLKGDTLSVSERRDLGLVAADGARAKEQMIESNLRLVIARAKRRHRPSRTVPTLLDLIQEGNIGLMQAVEMFDYTKGRKFSTFATFRIDREIGLAIKDTERTIYVPRWQTEKWYGIQTVRRELISELKRHPSDAEIAKKANITVKDLASMRTIFRPNASLDEYAESEDGYTLGDTVADRQPDVVDQVIKEATPEYEALCAVLTEAELRVLHFFSGLRNTSYEDIGRIIGLTHKQVISLQKSAYAKLQHPSVQLTAFLDVKKGNPVVDDWRDDAACKDQGPNKFFGKGAKDTSLCETCPVAGLCLQYAVDQDIYHGYWGGLPAQHVNTERRKAERTGQAYTLPAVGPQERKSA